MLHGISPIRKRGRVTGNEASLERFRYWRERNLNRHLIGIFQRDKYAPSIRTQSL